MKHRFIHRCLIAAYFLGHSLGHPEATAQTTCDPQNGITPICGFASPEDIDVLEPGAVLIVGGFNLDDRNGDLRTLNLADGSVETIFTLGDPQSSAPAMSSWGDPQCPGPPAGFAAHGIHVSTNPDGSIALLAVNHTSREAIEWFEITRTGDRYRGAWRGCVVVPGDLWINDIARLPDGGFVASHMMPRSQAMTMFDRPMNDRVETGYVVQWDTTAGWRRIPGTDGALPNGIQVSKDGAIIYSDHYLANEVVAVNRLTGARLWTATLPGAPDNLSITPDGRLIVTMHLENLRVIQVCLTTPANNCALRFANAYIDASNGAVTPIIETGGAPFGGSTVAVQVGDYIYMGAFAGDRIGRIPAP